MMASSLIRSRNVQRAAIAVARTPMRKQVAMPHLSWIDGPSNRILLLGTHRL